MPIFVFPAYNNLNLSYLGNGLPFWTLISDVTCLQIVSISHNLPKIANN